MYTIIVMDLLSGETIHKETTTDDSIAIKSYLLLSKHYTNYCSNDKYIVLLLNSEIADNIRVVHF